MQSRRNWLSTLSTVGSIGQIANKGYIGTLVDNDDDIQRL